MKTLAIVVLIVLLFAVIGWLTFRVTNERTTISIETQEIEQDTQRAVDRGKELLEGTGDAIEDATDDADSDSTNADTDRARGPADSTTTPKQAEQPEPQPGSR